MFVKLIALSLFLISSSCQITGDQTPPPKEQLSLNETSNLEEAYKHWNELVPETEVHETFTAASEQRQNDTISLKNALQRYITEQQDLGGDDQLIDPLELTLSNHSTHPQQDEWELNSEEFAPQNAAAPQAELKKDKNGYSQHNTWLPPEDRTLVKHHIKEESNKHNEEPLPFAHIDLEPSTKHSSTDLTQASTTKEHPSKQTSTTHTITANQVLIRTGPSTRYRQIGSLNKGDTVQVMQQKSGWCKIQSYSQDEERWVSANYLKNTSAIK